MIVIFFLLGIVVGSFLNMLVWRMHHEESILGRSYCDKTKKQLKPVDLIPVFSYIWHKGGCRECGDKLPLVYPLTEIISGAIAVLVYLQVNTFVVSYGELFLNILVALIIAYIMLYFAIYDFHYWSVEVRSIIAAFVVVTLLVVLNEFFSITPLLPSFLSALYGAVAGASLIGFVVWITRGGGMGTGDIFLFGLTGLIVGLHALWWAFMITVLTGSFIGIFVLIFTKKIKGVRIQFAPLIALGTIIVFLYKVQILDLVAMYLYY